MGFRDEEEARRARIDAFLAQREAQEERLEALEARLEALETKVAAKPRPPITDEAPSSSRNVLLAGGAIALCALIGFFMTRGDKAPDDKVATEESAPTLTDRPREPSVEMAVAAPVQAPVQAPIEEPEPPAEASIFAGGVTAAEGSSVREGDRCEVFLDTGNLSYLLPPDRLEVRCSEELLYSHLGETPCRVHGQTEIFGGTFALTCRDRGIREDRPELELNTLERELRLWSETDGWSLTVALDHPAARIPLQRPLRSPSGLPLSSPHEMVLQVEERLGEGAPSADALTLVIAPHTRPQLSNCDLTLKQGRRSLGETDGWCAVDVDLNTVAIDAALRDDDGFGVEWKRDESVVSINSAEGDHSWRIRAAIVTPE
ncbi:MAG: hypothetical protein AAGE52_29500 [Myxococcota bacterium]